MSELQQSWMIFIFSSAQFFCFEGTVIYFNLPYIGSNG